MCPSSLCYSQNLSIMKKSIIISLINITLKVTVNIFVNFQENYDQGEDLYDDVLSTSNNISSSENNVPHNSEHNSETETNGSYQGNMHHLRRFQLYVGNLTWVCSSVIQPAYFLLINFSFSGLLTKILLMQSQRLV